MLYIYNSELKLIGDTPYALELLKQVQPEYATGIWYFSKTKFNNPKLVNGYLEEKDNYDLYLEGSYALSEGEKVEENKIIIVPKPLDMLKPKWDFTNFIWEEQATPEEIDEYNFNKAVDFYNSELEFATKATAELTCEIISAEHYAGVKEYMKAIDPYAPKTFSLARVKRSAIERPLVFDRYK